MLIFGQRSCFLGPRQLVIQKVNVLYHTLHSKRNLKCQKWPAVKNWTWVLTFRRCLYRIWLHFKILATLQFFFENKDNKMGEILCQICYNTQCAKKPKKAIFIWIWKAIWKELIAVNIVFTNTPTKLTIFSHRVQRCAHLHAALWLLSIFYKQGVETLIRFLGLLQKKRNSMYLCFV